MVEPEIGGIYDSFGRERIREEEEWYDNCSDLDEYEIEERRMEEEANREEAAERFSALYFDD